MRERRHWRLRRVCLLVAVVALASLLVYATGATGSPGEGRATAHAAAKATIAERYTPFRHGRIKSSLNPRYLGRGDCWTTSLVVPVTNVYRCMKGHYIYDPCYLDLFSARERVVCAPAPWKRKVFVIRSGTPDDDYTSKRRPWGLILTSGRRCRFADGATTVVHGRRLNFICTGHRFLFGWPDRGPRKWTIRQARTGDGDDMKKVRVRRAWL